MTGQEESLQVDIEEIKVMSELFHQMADPTRLLLLMSMFGGEKCVCELAEKTDVSVSAVSHQLRSLRTARLVRSRRKGRHVFYRLDDDHVRDLVSKGLEHVRE
ncbi:MAG: metalloregulator ArsR/SmtB family transcription factor [Candidatus Aegiribacteria sp.]|nr:metalloregulator ArsR/SmtB family transcription factor [Candidatus Aegiribacteria sp.]